MTALFALAAGCKGHLSAEGVTWLGAIERELDHGVSLAVGVCKPDRADATAWQAQATATGDHALLGELLACASSDECAAPFVSAASAEIEARLDDEARHQSIETRETLARFLAAAGTTKKGRAQAVAVLGEAVATAEKSSKLVRVCGSPERRYDMSQAMRDLDETRARFRASIKAMHTDP